MITLNLMSCSVCRAHLAHCLLCWSVKQYCVSAQVSDPTPEEVIRGFRVVRKETHELVFDQPGDYLVPPETSPAAAAGAAAPAAQNQNEVDAALEIQGGPKQPPAAAAAAAPEASLAAKQEVLTGTGTALSAAAGGQQAAADGAVAPEVKAETGLSVLDGDASEGGRVSSTGKGSGTTNGGDETSAGAAVVVAAAGGAEGSAEAVPVGAGVEAAAAKADMF